MNPRLSGVWLWLEGSLLLLVSVVLVGCGGSVLTGDRGGRFAGVPDLAMMAPADLMALCQPGAPAVCDGNVVKQCDGNSVLQTRRVCPAGTICVEGVCDDLRCPEETTPPAELGALPVNAWPRYRHDNRNSGWTRIAVADSPKLKWKVFVGGAHTGKALAAGAVVNQDNRVFVGAGNQDGMGGSFYSYDAAGKLLYQFAAMRGWGLSTPAVRADGTAYFASQDSFLYAVKPDGTALWKYKTGANADGDPIVTREGILIYASDDKSLYALNPKGTLLWQSDAAAGPGEVDGALAQACDGRVLAGGINGWYALDAVSGKTDWSVKAQGAISAADATPLLGADGTMYGVDYGGIGYAIDKGGQILWMRKLGADRVAPSLARVGETLFVVLRDGKLHALKTATGEELWARDVGNTNIGSGELIAGPVVDGNLRLYFNSTDGYLYSFELDGTMRFRIAASGVDLVASWAGNISIGNDGTLYVPGNDGTLYAFQ